VDGCKSKTLSFQLSSFAEARNFDQLLGFLSIWCKIHQFYLLISETNLFIYQFIYFFIYFFIYLSTFKIEIVNYFL